MQIIKKILTLLILLLMTCVYAEEDPTDNRSLEKNKVFHLYDDVDLVSTIKFEYARPSITVKIVYPQLRNNNENAEEEDNENLVDFNETVFKLVSEEIEKFKKDVAESRDLQRTIPWKKLRNDFFIDYAASVVNANRKHILSIRFSFQGIIDGQKNRTSYHRVLNYVLEDGENMELSELFRPGTNYILFMSNYAQDVLFKRLNNKFLVAAGAGPDEENFKNWNIKPNGLLLTFEKRQIAPSIYGTQTLLIPYAVIKQIITPASLIWACVHKKNRCLHNNLLTGGFIDEAKNTKTHPVKPRSGRTLAMAEQTRSKP